MAASTQPDQKRRRVAVLGGNRIPFARSDTAYAEASNQDMFTATLDGLVDRFGLQGETLGAVIGGAVLKHSRDFNLMRECVLGTALSPYTPAFDLQQACGTGLQAAIAAVDGIAAGRYEVAAAGGVDTTSDAPIGLGDNLRRSLLALRRSLKSSGTTSGSVSFASGFGRRDQAGFPLRSRIRVCVSRVVPSGGRRCWSASG